MLLGLVQISRAQVQDLSIDKTSTPSGPGLHVANLKNKDIAALLLTVNCSSGPLEIFYDPLIDYGTVQAIPPGKGGDITIPERMVDCPRTANAVLLSDGSQDGDPSSVNKIMARRHGAYKQLTMVELHLAQVFSKKEDILDVTKAIKIARTDLASNKEITVAELSGSHALLSFLEYLLKQHELPHVPQYPDQPIPTIRSLMQTRALTPDQAYILCFDLRLREWIADLRLGGAASVQG
jgi:hypothetical protein